MTTEQLPDKKPSLTARQQRFVEEYCVDCNATQAAIRAGYGEKSARFVGCENLTKPNIAAAIKVRLEQLSMRAEEAVKHISDIAATRLNDYIKVVKVKRPTTVLKPVAEVIRDIEREMEFEDEYAELAELNELEQKSHEAAQKERHRRIIRYQLMLERDPNATVEVVGDPEEVEEAEVDLVALAKSRDKGRIKELSFGEFGPKVKLYDADSALVKVLEIHGKVIQLHQHSGPNGGPISHQHSLAGLTDEELDAIINAGR